MCTYELAFTTQPALPVLETPPAWGIPVASAKLYLCDIQSQSVLRRLEEAGLPHTRMGQRTLIRKCRDALGRRDIVCRTSPRQNDEKVWAPSVSLLPGAVILLGSGK